MPGHALVRKVELPSEKLHAEESEDKYRDQHNEEEVAQLHHCFEHLQQELLQRGPTSDQLDHAQDTQVPEGGHDAACVSHGDLDQGHSHDNEVEHVPPVGGVL